MLRAPRASSTEETTVIYGVHEYFSHHGAEEQNPPDKPARRWPASRSKREAGKPRRTTTSLNDRLHPQ